MAVGIGIVIVVVMILVIVVVILVAIAILPMLAVSVESTDIRMVRALAGSEPCPRTLPPMLRPSHPVAPDSLFARHGARLIHEKLQVLRLLRALDRIGINPAKVRAVQTPLVRLAEVDAMLATLLEGFERFGCESPTAQETSAPDPISGVIAIAEEARANVRVALSPSDQRYLAKALTEVVATEAEVWTEIDEVRARSAAAKSRTARSRPLARPGNYLSDEEVARAKRRAWGPDTGLPVPAGREKVLAFERQSLPSSTEPLLAWFTRLPLPWQLGIARGHDVAPDATVPLAERIAARLGEEAWLREYLTERVGSSERERLAQLLAEGSYDLDPRGGELDERFQVPWDWNLDRPVTTGGKLRVAGFAHVGTRDGMTIVTVPPALVKPLTQALAAADPVSADLPRRAVAAAKAHSLEGKPFTDPELQRWKSADRAVVERFQAWALAAKPSEKGLAAFFGHGERELRSPPETEALVDFMLFDWRETPGAPTVAELALPTATFASDDERAIAVATMAAHPALYRIERIEPGVGFDALPLFPPGPSIWVRERAMSLTTRKGQVVPLRVVPVGPFHFVHVCGDPIAHGREEAVLRTLRRRALARDPAAFVAADPAAFYRVVREHAD